MSCMLLFVLLLTLAGPAAYAAERGLLPNPAVAMASRAGATPRMPPSVMPPASSALVRAGGRVTFAGAIVVGTATTPIVVSTSGGAGVLATVQTGHFGDPARVVVVRRLAQQEQSSQLKLLERPGERVGRLKEAVVTYM